MKEINSYTVKPDGWIIENGLAVVGIVKFNPESGQGEIEFKRAIKLSVGDFLALGVAIAAIPAENLYTV